MKDIFLILSLILGIVAYVPYFRGIFAGKVVPHIYSWSIWTLIGYVSFAAQLAGGGGQGSMMLGFTASACLMITILAFFYGQKKGDSIDILCVGFALLAIFLWYKIGNPLYATVFVTVADMIGYIPTLRKIYHFPQSEPYASYILSSGKHIFGILALSVYTVATCLFSVSVIFMNLIILMLMYIRTK